MVAAASPSNNIFFNFENLAFSTPLLLSSFVYFYLYLLPWYLTLPSFPLIYFAFTTIQKRQLEKHEATVKELDKSAEDDLREEEENEELKRVVKAAARKRKVDDRLRRREIEEKKRNNIITNGNSNSNANNGNSNSNSNKNDDSDDDDEYLAKMVASRSNTKKR
ncbi:hypothetical protein ScalyP_jg7610 [Parmales sp. scaly parma]|nr:hypothetical protein ScalyP_jg7610 [Parmales sp. scaly parma]